jgi:hypothetical protein
VQYVRVDSFQKLLIYCHTIPRLKLGAFPLKMKNHKSKIILVLLAIKERKIKRNLSKEIVCHPQEEKGLDLLCLSCNT